MKHDALLHPEHSPAIQSFGGLAAVRLGLAKQLRHRSIAAINRLLAHTTALRDLDRKAHWRTLGPSFYKLHLLFEKHYGEHEQLMDRLIERVQTPGGAARALASDIVDETRLARTPSGVESAVDQLRCPVDAHESVLEETRPLARDAATVGGDGSNDLTVGQVVRRDESQSWFLLRHLTPNRNEHGSVVADHLALGGDAGEIFAIQPCDPARQAS